MKILHNYRTIATLTFSILFQKNTEGTAKGRNQSIKRSEKKHKFTEKIC